MGCIRFLQVLVVFLYWDPLVNGYSTVDLSSEDAIMKFHSRNEYKYKSNRHVPISNDIAEAREKVLFRVVSQSVCEDSLIIERSQKIIKKFGIKKPSAKLFENQWFMKFVCDIGMPSSECQQNLPLTSIKCDSNAKFRTIDGTCNNLERNMQGAAEQTFQRFLNNLPSYDDGVTSPRANGRTKKLPRPRDISVAMTEEGSEEGSQGSLLLMQWGQATDHDLVLTAESETISGSSSVERVSCCEDGKFDEQVQANCMPLDLQRDPFFQRNGINCRRFVRSLAVTDGCLGVRQQLNLVTSFVDASHIYGSSTEEEAVIRSHVDGLLRTNEDLTESESCSASTPSCPLLPVHKISAEESEIFAGDERAQEQPGLTSIHTLLLRFHNFLAEKYKENHLLSSDEEIFQEVRRIVGAVVQRITYAEFLPIVLGSKAMKDHNLIIVPGATTNQYDSKINPSAFNVFATAAFRFGHSLVGEEFKLFTRTINLFENFNNFKATMESGQFPSDYLEGMGNTKAENQDHVIIKALTNKLGAEAPFTNGSDLFAINILRGRDHGLDSFNSWRNLLKLVPFENFEDMNGKLRPAAIKALKKVYSNVDDIDLFPGALAEITTGDGILGPTFTYIIGRQFNNLRFGDRFWFETQPVPFTAEQLMSIKKTTLTSLICKFTRAKTFQTNAMNNPDNTSNKLIPCTTEFDNVVEKIKQFW